MQIKDQNINSVLKHLKEGKMAEREGWNGKNMFIFQRPYDNIDISVLPNIKSLPESVKKYFIEKWAGNEIYYMSGNPIQVHFTEYLCLVDPQGNIVNGWTPSISDLLAEDWIIFE